MLHVFRQHVIARQQLLLRAQVFVQQQLAAPGIDLLAVVAQAVVQQRLAVRPKAFEIAGLHLKFFRQHFQRGGRQALLFQQPQCGIKNVFTLHLCFLQIRFRTSVLFIAPLSANAR
ncbi:hypothetical protein D3C79_882220 [compost metagenome]